MESEIITLIAKDRLEIPLSSMYQRVKKAKAREEERTILVGKYTIDEED